MQPEVDTRVLARREPEEATLTVGGPARAAVSPDRARPSLASASAMDSPAGRWVGRYELIHRLAHGGMATVYLGRAKGKAGFEKVVAVKVIHPHLASEAEFVGMFLDEARIAARIHHPHVVEILDLGESEGGYYMVMEFIEGENLAALVRALGSSPERKLPIPVILQLLADTLEGLAAAHELRDGNGQPYQLVHRDVSPHNILINLDGWAKVGDFGIMKAAGKASNTRTGELRGKLAYMSPEQARGGQVDPRTDLFAVGVIAWELLTGQRLFACTTEAATLEKVIACKVPPLDPTEHERPELGELGESSGRELSESTQPGRELRLALDALLGKAMALRPEDRFANAQQMLTEVRRLRRMAFERAGDTTREPRKHLGALMARYFQTRVDYARMALRRTGEYEALVRPLATSESSAPRESASTSAAWSLEPTVQVEAGQRAPTNSVPIVAPALVEMTPTGARESTTTNPVVVQQSAGSRVLQWLLLPMLGAAIALLAMLLLGRGPDREPSEPSPEPLPAQPTEGPRTTPSLAATEYQVTPRRAASDQVSWCFTTIPAGAEVSVAGVVQAKPTPNCVSVPAGDQPIAVELVLAGYEPLHLDLTPVANQNFPEKLTPSQPEPASQDRARVRKSKPGEAKPPSADDPNKQFIPVPDSLLDGDGG